MTLVHFELLGAALFSLVLTARQGLGRRLERLTPAPERVSNAPGIQ